MQKIIRKTIQRVLENSFSRELYIEREDFLEVVLQNFPFKYWKRSALKMRISSKQNLSKDSEGIITNHTLMTMLVVVGKSQRSKGTLHWVSIKHAVEAEAC
jgi:glutaminyl-tRNA synthetase